MANFIPPLDLGQFTPSAAAISSWLYQIWKYLQENPIQSDETIQREITESVSKVVPGAVADYLEENPVDVPVISVNGMIGAVVLAYNNLVGDSSTLPIYRAATGETSNNDLLDAWAEGCRFLLVDDTTPYMMVKNVDQGSEVINLVPLSGGGGGGGGDVSSVNGKTGAVTLVYTDFVGSSSTIPVLRAANDEISNNDLITAWNQGYRFVVVDGTEPYIILRSGNTASLLPIGNKVSSVNGKTGAVTLTYPDINPPTSNVPLMITANMPAQAELLNAWNNGNRFLLVDSGNNPILYALKNNVGTIVTVAVTSSGSSGKYTKLWENENPGTAFAAQTVNLSDNANNYNLLLVGVMFDTNYTIIYGNIIFVTTAYTQNLWFCATGANRTAGRQISIAANGASVSFGVGQYNGNNSVNTAAIPVFIYGLKV